MGPNVFDGDFRVESVRGGKVPTFLLVGLFGQNVNLSDICRTETLCRNARRTQQRDPSG